MKCSECDGYKNFVSLAGTPFEVVRPCKRCNGTGEVEMTEQEYIQTCTTEQLVDVLAKQKCDGCHDEPYDEKYGVCKYCMMKKKEQIMEWLKQPHQGE
jgi:hypothetical protein